MGWYYEDKARNQSVKEWFASSLSEKFELLDLAVVKFRVMYAAVKSETGEVWAAVYLLDLKGDRQFNFGYKPMDETMGPCESECPERILKLLTPTDSKYANEWRERCQNNINKRKGKPKVVDGCMIKFANPIHFTNGSMHQTFSVSKQGNQVTFFVNGGRYRISKWREREFEVVS